MRVDKWTGRQCWLKVACLAVSVGLHVGLGGLGWQGFGVAPIDSGPIMVTLAEFPATEPAGILATKPSSSLRSSANSASAVSRRSPTPVANSVANLPTNEPPTTAAFCAIPETIVVETVLAAAPQDVPVDVGEMGGKNFAGGEGSGSGAASGPAAVSQGGVDGGEGQTLGGLILATPRYASNPRPEYPRLARQNRWEGIVHLRATISAQGEVDAVTVENSSGYQLLDASALNGVRRWRFVPARRGELQVPCEVRIPVAFKLERQL